jgi:hypothetical protein
MALFILGAATMPVSPFEPDANRRPTDGRHPPGHDAAVRPEMRAAPREEREEQRADETIEEPGYGHGV